MTQYLGQTVKLLGRKKDDRPQAASTAQGSSQQKLVLKLPKHCCPTCSERFESKQQLDRHVAKEICAAVVKLKVPCGQCDKTFRTEAQVYIF